MSKLSKVAFHSEPQAFEYLEKTLWPDGAVCPHCGVVGNATKLQGKATRIGVWKCNDCRKQFMVKVGTVFKHGRIPCTKCSQAVYLLSSAKRAAPAAPATSRFGHHYKSAWFLSHRIREAMRAGNSSYGGSGSIVEVDES